MKVLPLRDVLRASHCDRTGADSRISSSSLHAADRTPREVTPGAAVRVSGEGNWTRAARRHVTRQRHTAPSRSRMITTSFTGSWGTLLRPPHRSGRSGQTRVRLARTCATARRVQREGCSRSGSRSGGFRVLDDVVGQVVDSEPFECHALFWLLVDGLSLPAGGLAKPKDWFGVLARVMEHPAGRSVSPVFHISGCRKPSGDGPASAPVGAA